MRGTRSDEGFYEAFKLGLGQPVAISAEHGLGLGDLERDCLAALGLDAKVRRRGESGEVEKAEPERPLRVAIVGRPNAGKSTLVNAILGEDRMITGPEPGLTRDAVASDFTRNGRDMKLFDTARLAAQGQGHRHAPRSFRRATPSALSASPRSSSSSSMPSARSSIRI